MIIEFRYKEGQHWVPVDPIMSWVMPALELMPIGAIIIAGNGQYRQKHMHEFKCECGAKA